MTIIFNDHSIEDHMLAVVMPVYNEEECIQDVIQSWDDALCRLNIDFVIVVLNDGSTDGTKNKLSKFVGDKRISIVNKYNSGHGPTILKGYHAVVDRAEWVFQTDSDDEIKPAYFAELWNRRDDYDALLGIRECHQKEVDRKVISFVSRLTTKILFGKSVIDVNVPYRLIRCEILENIIEHIPDNTFAPNVIISGVLSASGARIFNCFVLHENRKTGSVSIVKWKLWKAAATSLWQTVKIRSRLKKATLNINSMQH